MSSLEQARLEASSDGLTEERDSDERTERPPCCRGPSGRMAFWAPVIVLLSVSTASVIGGMARTHGRRRAQSD